MPAPAIDTDYLRAQLEALLSIPSPTGYTDTIVHYVSEELGRTREAVVTGVEDRDGVRFYVEPSSALEPIKLVRTPGLSRDRTPAGHPPPPPPEREAGVGGGRPA